MMTAEFLKFIEDPSEVAKVYKRFLYAVADASSVSSSGLNLNKDCTPDSDSETFVMIATTFDVRQAERFSEIIHRELKPEWN